MNKEEFLKEKDLLLNSIENNTKEHWENYYKGVPIECIYDDLVIDINEIKRLTEENQKLKADYGNKAQVERDLLLEENKDLKKQLKEVEFIVGLRQKRNLINKFDKEYDEEDKKKNPNRDYAGIMPDAEEVYKRYYSMKKQQKEFVEYMNKTIEELECDDEDDEEMKGYLIQRIDTFKEILSKFKKIIGDDK